MQSPKPAIRKARRSFSDPLSAYGAAPPLSQSPNEQAKELQSGGARRRNGCTSAMAGEFPDQRKKARS